MTKKNKRALIIVASAVLLVTVITVAYAYFIATVSVPKQQTVVAETGTMRLVMNDGNAGWSEVWDFGESKSKTFTLQNTGSLPVTVDLYWKNLVNTFLEGSMVYSLKQTTDDATPVETYLVGSATTFENIPTSVTSVSTNKIAEQITVPANKTYTYTLTIQLVNSPTVDQTADLNANFYTEFDIKEYVEPESPIKCLDSSGNEMTCPQTLEVGQRIAIGDEVFRFIRYTSTSSNLNECGGESGTSIACGDATDGDIRALAEYNLYVGNIARDYSIIDTIPVTDVNYGRQSNIALGFNHNDDWIGTVAFSSEDIKGTHYSSYTGSIVEDYVEEYVQYLSDTYGTNVSGGLITMQELLNTNLFNCEEFEDCPYEVNGKDTSWINDTKYWTGSPASTYRMFEVGMDNGRDCTSNFYLGVRPVITIPASYFN